MAKLRVPPPTLPPDDRYYRRGYEEHTRGRQTGGTGTDGRLKLVGCAHIA
jgi:hypothetical protein